MKKVILILVVLFYGCNSNENQIENIEIISYYYKPNNDYGRLTLDCVNYSTIDNNGNAQTIKRLDSGGKKYVEYKSIIDDYLLKDVFRKYLKKNNKYYIEKTDDNLGEFQNSPINRVKIKFKDNHIITFRFTNRIDNSKHILFIGLLNNLENNFTYINFSSIDKEDLQNLKNKQIEFEKYTINKDTLDFPFPPPPKLNFVNFKK